MIPVKTMLSDFKSVLSDISIIMGVLIVIAAIALGIRILLGPASTRMITEVKQQEQALTDNGLAL